MSKQASDPVPLKQPEKELFEQLEKDYKDVKYDVEEQATIVQNIGDSRSERVPWLHDMTGFLFLLTNLQDDQIKSSYKLPPKNKTDIDVVNTNLVRIVAAAKAVLRDVYRMCCDTSPDRKMTGQRANTLERILC